MFLSTLLPLHRTCTNREGDILFLPFCTIKISMYQKRKVTDRQTDREISTPLSPYYFFLYSTERAGPYPQAQLYWAGRTMGWMAD